MRCPQPDDAGGPIAPVAPEQARVAPHGPVGHQHHAGGAVGDLAAPVAAGPAVDHRVGLRVVGEAVGAEAPLAGLGQRVGAGVGEGLLRQGVEVDRVEPVAAVVLLGQVGEGGRPDVAGLALVPDPRRRAHGHAGVVAGLRALDLDAEHQGDVVAPGLEVGHGGEDGEAARRARPLVTGRGHAPQGLLDRGRHGAPVALAGHQLAEGVAHVDDLDPVGAGAGVLEGRPHDLGDQPVGPGPVLGDVAGEVALVPAQDPDAASLVARAHGPDARSRGARRAAPA